ncbi:SMI1/KNR4 family protein [Dactylosporangium sp. NPDC048998]|uniref:SMI1/KNR4 family protein n=1 Tax=Dactylosporangium sp. NPDC048998 TaxID=3363976 RepID=UPI003716356E
MHAEPLDRLLAAYPPLRPAPERDWAAFEERFGRPLPADYKAFVDAYGHARFGEFLTVYVPDGVSEFVELDTQRAFAGLKAEYLLETEGELLGTPALPVDPRELLPVAGTANGNSVYWHAPPGTAPDAWTIAVDQARGDTWFLFDGGIVAFLVAVFVDGLRVTTFPDGLDASVSGGTGRPGTATCSPPPAG